MPPPARPGPSRPRAICAALRQARKCLRQRIEHAAAAPDDGFAHGYVTTVAAVEAGFRHEELIMETLGYAQLQAHRAENAVVLSALHRVLPDVEGGDCALGRQVLAALLDVLELHRLSIDLALTVAAQPLAAGAHGKVARGKAGRPVPHVTT
jgi:hemerythrin